MTVIKARPRGHTKWTLRSIDNLSRYPCSFRGSCSLCSSWCAVLHRHCKRSWWSGATAATVVIIKQKTMLDADNKEEVRGSSDVRRGGGQRGWRSKKGEGKKGRGKSDILGGSGREGCGSTHCDRLNSRAPDSFSFDLPLSPSGSVGCPLSISSWLSYLVLVSLSLFLPPSRPLRPLLLHHCWQSAYRQSSFSILRGGAPSLSSILLSFFCPPLPFLPTLVLNTWSVKNLGILFRRSRNGRPGGGRAFAASCSLRATI